MEFTISEAAARAGVSESTIRAARTAGAFKSARQEVRGNRNPRWLIQGDELDAAGFVPFVAAPTHREFGPVYIEQRLISIAAQIVEMLDALSAHGQLLSGWMERSRDDALVHGQRLEAMAASVIESLAAGELAALQEGVDRLAAEVHASCDELTSTRSEVAALGFVIAVAKPGPTARRWRRLFGALRR